MKVLVIVPHPDDEILGCGGTMSWNVNKGDNVKICIVCCRAYQHTHIDEYIKEAKESAVKAKEVLKYHEGLFLDLNDQFHNSPEGPTACGWG